MKGIIIYIVAGLLIAGSIYGVFIYSPSEPQVSIEEESLATISEFSSPKLPKLALQDVSDLEYRIDDLESQIYDLESRIDDLEGQISDLEWTNSDLEGRIDDLESYADDFDELSDDLTDFIGCISRMSDWGKPIMESDWSFCKSLHIPLFGW